MLATRCYTPSTGPGLTYTVSWHDGDQTGKEVHYDELALDATPATVDVGVGTVVIFPQGRYRATEGGAG